MAAACWVEVVVVVGHRSLIYLSHPSSLVSMTCGIVDALCFQAAPVVGPLVEL